MSTETSDKTGAATKPSAKPTEKAPAPKGVLLPPSGKSTFKLRRWRLAFSFVVCVLLSSALGAVYYLQMASDRYAAGASFVVRGFGTSGGSDLIGSFTGITSSGSTTSDSYIIRRYLLSGDLLLLLEKKLPLREHYSDPSIDLISRFNADLPFEDFIKYWSRRIITTYDSTTGIVAFEVQGFDPDFTLELASEILAAADTLVNDLSQSARQDSLAFALAEVERAEAKLREAQVDLRQFRSNTGTADPTVNAQLEAELISNLEIQLTDVQARIATLGESVNPDSPVLRQLERRQLAIQAQIDARRAAVGSDSEGNKVTSADNLGVFEDLQIEQTFAQQRYASALTSLEQARMEADQLQRYLAVFSTPLMPDDAVYPMRVRNTFLFALAVFVLWSIVTLIVYAVRDHLR